MKETIIGKSILRKEGRGKVTGSARYIDDLDFPGMLHGATVRSRYRARQDSQRSNSAKAFPWNEFTIVTAKDIPGKNYVLLITNDQPCLADEFVNHAEEADRPACSSRQISAGRSASRGAHRDRCAPGRLHHRGFARQRSKSSGATTISSSPIEVKKGDVDAVVERRRIYRRG